MLNVRAIDDNMVGQGETTLKRAAGYAAIQKLGFRTFVGHTAGDEQRVVLHRDVQIFRTETCYRHRQAIGVVAGLLNVVGRVSLRFLAGSRGVHKPSQPVETNGGAEKR